MFRRSEILDPRLSIRLALSIYRLRWSGRPGNAPDRGGMRDEAGRVHRHALLSLWSLAACRCQTQINFQPGSLSSCSLTAYILMRDFITTDKLKPAPQENPGHPARVPVSMSMSMPMHSRRLDAKTGWTASWIGSARTVNVFTVVCGLA